MWLMATDLHSADCFLCGTEFYWMEVASEGGQGPSPHIVITGIPEPTSVWHPAAGT